MDRSDVRRVEEAWGVSLPADFVEFVIANSDAPPDPARDGVEGVEWSGWWWTWFDPDQAIENHRTLREQRALPEGIYPFVKDPGGNYMAFDYSVSPDAPAVVFLDLEILDEQGRFEPCAMCGTFTALHELMIDGTDDEDE
jgi:SMI1 / KNR4 family.